VFGVGIELLALKALVIRGGYTSAGDLGDGLRAGAGLRFKTFQIDYAYAGAGSLGSAHRLGLTIAFGQKRTDPLSLAESRYRKGQKEFNEHRYSEALEDFNKALQIDPSHPDVKEMMDKTYEKLDKTLPE
jgi:tetratricopeptide (TPR) repeat protein